MLYLYHPHCSRYAQPNFRSENQNQNPERDRRPVRRAGEKNVVFIVAVGRRKEGSKEDIYTLAKKLLKLKLLER